MWTSRHVGVGRGGGSQRVDQSNDPRGDVADMADVETQLLFRVGRRLDLTCPSPGARVRSRVLVAGDEPRRGRCQHGRLGAIGEVDGLHMDTGGIGDGLHGRGLVAALGEEVAGGLLDFAAGVVARRGREDWPEDVSFALAIVILYIRTLSEERDHEGAVQLDPDGGCLHAVRAVGAALLAAGHEVLVATGPDLQSRVAGDGFATAVAGPTAMDAAIRRWPIPGLEPAWRRVLAIRCPMFGG